MIFIKGIKQKIGFGIIMSLFLLLNVFGAKMNVKAAEVMPVHGILYTSQEAKLYDKPDGKNIILTLPVNTPIVVTGQTTIGYFQIKVGDNTYYIQATEVSVDVTEDINAGINAAAALVGDVATGEIYYNKDMLARRAPASTTKIMTALLVYEAIERGEITYDTPVIVSSTAIAGFKTDASHVTPRLKSGEILTVEQLLQCVMLKSDCYACNVLAETVSGSVEGFVEAMNKRAQELGCVETNFVNTHGYPAENHYSNAYSLFLIAKQAVRFDQFNKLVAMTNAIIPRTNLTEQRTLKTTNELIKPTSQYYNPYAFGLKTGSAKSSGLCFVASAVDESNMVISVVLGAQKVTIKGKIRNNQFYETNKLLKYGLAMN